MIKYAIMVVIFIVLGIFALKICYKKCPPNKAMVITGPSGTTVVSGKSKFIIPFIYRVDYMTLENIQVDFTSKDEVPTKDAINIMVDAVANLSIAKDDEGMKIAASKFLGYEIGEIQELVLPILEGNIREIISQTTLKELIQGDKKQFSERVMDNVIPNLRELGLSLTGFNIQNFKDRNGVIENLGIEHIEEISKDAKMAKAQAEAEVAIARAKAKKDADKAEVEAETEIIKRRNELDIQKAELKKQADKKQAEADAAKNIQQQAERKVFEAASGEAELAKQEKEIELKQRSVAIKEQELEANVKKTAEANKFAAQQESDAALYHSQKQAEANLYNRQKNAEAEKYESEQKAEAKKIEAEKEAEAMKALAAAKIEEGKAEAAAIRAIGEAKAAAKTAELTAEADGLRSKAEAYKAFNEAATEQMKLDTLKVYFEQLPEIAKAVGQGYNSVDKITMFGGESSKLAGDIVNTTTQISEGLSNSLGIDLKSLLSGMLGARIVDNNPEHKCICEKTEE